MYARASFRLVFVVAISKGRKRVEKMDEYEDKYSDVDEDEDPGGYRGGAWAAKAGTRMVKFE